MSTLPFLLATNRAENTVRCLHKVSCYTSRTETTVLEGCGGHGPADTVERQVFALSTVLEADGKMLWI